jgi:hypothetical protein
LEDNVWGKEHLFDKSLLRDYYGQVLGAEEIKVKKTQPFS